MLARSLPVAELQIGSHARISLSAKIASRLAQAAIDRAKSFEREIPNADDPLGMVEEVHSDWDLLKDIRVQLEQHVKDFRAAADAINGNIISGTSPLIELSVVTRSSFETLKMVDDNYDLSRVGETANLLSEAAEKLAEDLSIFKSRQIKHDMAIRRCALRALAVKHVDPSDLQNYEMPEDFELPPPVDAREHLQSQLDGTATKSLTQLRDDKYRAAAKSYFQSEADTANRIKRQRKAESRKQLRREIAELWT